MRFLKSKIGINNYSGCILIPFLILFLIITTVVFVTVTLYSEGKKLEVICMMVSKTITIPFEDLVEIQKFVETDKYSTISEFVQIAVKNEIMRLNS